jgi:NAD(P)-dependent dehydrogenase (short-subunit alcohol dehydrogenase family)
MGMVQDLAGKAAVITGGASGIGRAIAAQLVRRGADVVIADIEQAALDAAAHELGVAAIRVDVSSMDSVQALADRSLARLGRVDMVFSNAGIASAGRIEDMVPADWDWLLGVNVMGAAHAVQAFLPLLRANPAGGALAFTSSMAGFHVTPGIGGYTACKFAVTALAETLAAELAETAPGVAVTILCPGPVSTRLGASHRNRPGAAEGGLADVDLEASEAGRALNWHAPDKAARLLLAAMDRRALYAFTHPEWEPLVTARHAAIAQAFADIPPEV